MANKRPPKNSAEDALFEEFLQKQFAQLKRELAEYAPFEAAKENKVLSFEDRITRPKKSRGGWTIGIAAVVLVGVAVPIVIQLNRQKAELTQNSPTAGLEVEKPQQKLAEKDKTSDGRIAMDRDEAEEQSNRYYKTAPAKAKKADKDERIDDLLAGEKAETNLRASREEAAPKDGLATGKVSAPGNEQEGRRRTMSDAESTVSKKEEAKPERAGVKSGYARMDDAPSAPRPAAAAPKPAAVPAPTVAQSRSQSGGNQNAEAEDAAPAEAVKNSRSIAVDDAKSRLKKQDIASDEKAEMEKLWKEFEQDPKSFSQDKKRSARLRTLLSRHNEKSRAKRMRSIETQKAY